MIGYDSTSAGDLAQGYCSAECPSTLSAAITALSHLLDSLGRRPHFLHIKSHEGHPMNEAADCFAKAAAADLLTAPVPQTLAEAVADDVLPWMWCAIGTDRSVPALNAQGTFVDTTPQTVGPSLKTLLHKDLVQGEAQLRFLMATYNCLSVASHSQRESLNTQFRRRGVSLVGLQETRCSGETRSFSRDYHIFSSNAEQGQQGCQLWFARHEPAGWLGSQPLLWDANAFSVAFRAPRFLLVLARIGSIKFAVLCAHALTSRAPAQERTAWWNQLHKVFCMMPHSYIPVVLIDANARLAKPHKHEADNAAQLRTFLRHHELQHSACLSSDGTEICSWESPNGFRACIDYILCPRSLSHGFTTVGALQDFRGLVGHDHKPIVAKFELCQETSASQREPKLDYQFLGTPNGRMQLASLLHSIPDIPWETGVDEHLDIMNQHLKHGLQRICPRTPAFSKRDITSKTTWMLIQHRRDLRRCCHALRQDAKLHFLRAFFQGWRHSLVDADESAHLRDLNLALMGIQIRAASGHIIRSAKQDAAEATRTTFQEARKEGPERMHRLFRSILKTGRKYRRPQLAPAIVEASGTLAADANAEIGRHFAAAERAIPIEREALTTRPAAQEKLVLNVTKSFSLPQLAQAFGRLSAKKATGFSGIPAEVFRFAPILLPAHIWHWCSRCKLEHKYPPYGEEAELPQLKSPAKTSQPLPDGDPFCWLKQEQKASAGP